MPPKHKLGLPRRKYQIQIKWKDRPAYRGLSNPWKPSHVYKPTRTKLGAKWICGSTRLFVPNAQLEYRWVKLEK